MNIAFITQTLFVFVLLNNKNKYKIQGYLARSAYVFDAAVFELDRKLKRTYNEITEKIDVCYIIPLQYTQKIVDIVRKVKIYMLVSY